MTNDPGSSLEKDQNINSEIAAQKEAIAKAKDQIASKFKELRKKIGTPAAEYEEGIVLMVLQDPLNQIQQEIENDIQGGGGILSTSRLTEHGKRIDEAVGIAKAYMEKMTAETGGITPEVLVKMTRDINKKAGKLMKLLSSGKHQALLDAFRAALGSTDSSTDLPTAMKKAKEETIPKYLNSEFENSNSELMTYIWSILAFMNQDDRLEIANDYCKKKPQQTDKFLREGNKMGVFSIDEMETVNKERGTSKKYSAEEKKIASTNWKVQNDYRVEATKLAIIPYGTESDAGKMLTLPNIALGWIKFCCGVGLVGNFVTGVSSSGKFSLGAGLKRLTNAPSLVALAAYTAIKIGESKEDLTDILKGKQPEKEAKLALLREKKGNAQFTEWDKFFRQQKSAGAQAFFDFISYQKKTFDVTDVSKLYDYLTPAKFSRYLDMKAKEKKTNPDKSKDFDYAKLKAGFDAIKAPEIITFAKIFDALNIGGVNAKNQYEQALREDSAVA